MAKHGGELLAEFVEAGITGRTGEAAIGRTEMAGGSVALGTPAGENGPEDSAFAYDVAIIGLGYVGLPTAIAFESAGLRVLGVEARAERLDDIRSARADLLPSDQALLPAALERGLDLRLDPSLISSAAAVVVCVPTPVDEHRTPDLRALRAACDTVVKHARRGQLLILTSTSYAGCTRDLLQEPLEEQGYEIGKDLFVAFSAERIDPGVARFGHEDVPRVVGGSTPDCARRAGELLGRSVRSVYRASSLEVAEMSKLLENTFRAVNIAMINEFADMCSALGIPVGEVIGAADTKPYGFMKFMPGPGVGGHCIPCDPHYLLWQGRELAVGMPVVEQAMESIGRRPRQVVERAAMALSDIGRPLRGSRVLMLGISYKPNVADLRESPALRILAELQARGAIVGFLDPNFERVVLSGPAAGVTVEAVEDPEDFDPELVIVHTLHDSGSVSWLRKVPAVLDASYRLAGGPETRQL